MESGPRFRLATLFLFQATVAVWMWLFLQLGAAALASPVVFGFVGHYYGEWTLKRWLFATAFSSLIVLHLYSIPLAYEGCGMNYIGFAFLFWLQLWPLRLLAKHQPRLALATSCLIVCFALPYPLMWQHTLTRGKAEVQLIAKYAEQVKRQTGSYPQSLRGYVAHDREIAPYVTYDYCADTFYVYYHSGNSQAPHWYSPSVGWGFHDDR